MIAGRRNSGRNAFRYAGAGRILKGEKLDDLPVMLTAKALALAIAAGLLDIADEVDRRGPLWVIRVGLAGPRRLPVYPGERTFSG